MTKSKLFAYQEFVLLATADDSGKTLVGSRNFGYGLAASILLDLLEEECIEIRTERYFFTTAPRIYPIEGKEINDPKLEVCLNLINSKPPRTIKFWIDRLSSNYKVQFKKDILSEMVDLGILGKTTKDYILFTKSKFPTINAYIENGIRERLKNGILDKSELTFKDSSLLSILNCLQLKTELQLSSTEMTALNLKLQNFYVNDLLVHAIWKLGEEELDEYTDFLNPFK